MLIRPAQFNLGDIVHHEKRPYRGVIVDVDPAFAGPEDWLQEGGSPAGDQPWYHLVLDNSEQMAYVPEEQLEPDHSEEPVFNPSLTNLLGEFQDGRYKVRQTIN